MIKHIRTRLAIIFLAVIMVLAMLPGGIFLPITAQALGVTDDVIAVDRDGTSTLYTITQVLPAGNQTISDTGSPEVYLVEGNFANAAITVASNVSTVLVLNGTLRSAVASPLQIGANAN